MGWLWTLLLGWLCAWAASRYCRDMANPVSTYVLVWSASVTLFLMGWVSYLPVDSRLWWAISLSSGGFLLGGWSALIWGMPRDQTIRPVRFLPNLGRFKRLLMLFTCLGAIGFALQVRHLQATMGLELLIENPVLARELHSNVPIWGYLNLLNVANVPLVILYIGAGGRFRKWMIWTCLFAVLSALITTDRTRFFYMVIWGFFVWLYLPKEVLARPRKWIGLGLVVAILLLFFIGIGEHYDRNYRDRFPEHIHLKPEFSMLAEPYIYLTGSLAALDALLADENPMHKGKFSFSPLISLAQLVDPSIETVQLQGKLYFVPMEVNTFSYLQQFFHDFGWWGILLGPYFCGWFAAWFYALMRREPTFWRIYMTGLLSFCCVMSVFVNTFTQEATWFFVVLGLLIGYWIAGRERRVAEICDQVL